MIAKYGVTIVNSVNLDDSTAELSIIASNEKLNKASLLTSFSVNCAG